MRALLSTAARLLGRHHRALIVAGIVVLTLGVRVVGLRFIPGGLSVDEARLGVTAENITTGNLLTRSALPAFHLLWAGGIAATKDLVLVPRLISVLFGTGIVVAGYLLMRRLFDRRAAVLFGILAAVSSWQIILSRLALPYTMAVFCTVGAALAVVVARAQKRPVLCGLSGLLFGIGLLTHAGSLSVLPVLAFLLFRSTKKDADQAEPKDRSALFFLGGLLPPAAVFALILFHTHAFFDFMPTVGVPLRNFIFAVKGVYLSGSDLSWVRNLPGTPLLDPLTALLSLFGMLYGFMRLRNSALRALFVWLIAAFLLSGFGSPPVHAGVLLFAFFPVYAFAALAIEHGLSAWFRTFPFNRVARSTAALAVAVFVVISIAYNLERYFLAWDQAPQRQAVFRDDAALLAERIQKPSAVPAYVIGESDELIVLSYRTYGRGYEELSVDELRSFTPTGKAAVLVFEGDLAATAMTTLTKRFSKHDQHVVKDSDGRVVYTEVEILPND